MPEFFEPDEMGHGTTADSQVPAHLESQVRHVADNCPERAISIVEE
jgi:ferredoxin